MVDEQAAERVEHGAYAVAHGREHRREPPRRLDRRPQLELEPLAVVGPALLGEVLHRHEHPDVRPGRIVDAGARAQRPEPLARRTLQLDLLVQAAVRGRVLDRAPQVLAVGLGPERVIVGRSAHQLLAGEGGHRAERVVDLDGDAVAEDEQALLKRGQQGGGPAALAAERVLQRTLRGQRVGRQPGGRGRPALRRAGEREVAAELDDQALQAAEPEVAGPFGHRPRARVQPAAVVLDAHDHGAVASRHVERDALRAGVAGRVAQQLAGDVTDERVVDADRGLVHADLRREPASPGGVGGDAPERVVQPQPRQQVLVHRRGQRAQGGVGLPQVGVERVERPHVTAADLIELLAGCEDQLQGLVVEAVGQPGALRTFGCGDLGDQPRAAFGGPRRRLQAPSCDGRHPPRTRVTSATEVTPSRTRSSAHARSGRMPPASAASASSSALPRWRIRSWTRSSMSRTS